MEPEYPFDNNNLAIEVESVDDPLDPFADDGEVDLGFVPIDITNMVYLLDDQIVESGATITQSSLDCFSGSTKDYLAFINQETTWVNEFTRFWLPSENAFAWLNPYTGNAHNRSFFTQLALHVVARAKQCHNRTWYPDLYEAFVGSGQIFMGASAFADLLLEDEPFQGVGGGDLNPFLICAYQAMKAADFLTRYKAFAVDLDLRLDPSNGGGGKLVASVYADCVAAINALPMDDQHQFEIGAHYIWLVNRCLRGSTFGGGRFQAGLNSKIVPRDRRVKELRALTHVVRMVQAHLRFFAVADFAATTAAAAPKDIVVMDCPFPTFDRRIIADGGTGSVGSNIYGPPDGAGLQVRIIAEIRRLAAQGTTVVVCNFANPNLVSAYKAILMEFGIDNPKDYIYTYKSPGNESSVYQLVIVPGRRVNMTNVPATIRTIFDRVTATIGFCTPRIEMDSDSSAREESDSGDYAPGKQEEESNSDT